MPKHKNATRVKKNMVVKVAGKEFRFILDNFLDSLL